MPSGEKNNDEINNSSAIFELLKWLEQHKQEDKEDRRLMHKSINEHGEAIKEMLPMLKDCHKDLNGNGQPGLKKQWERHVSVQKWVNRVAMLAVGSITTVVAANWSLFLSKLYTLMKIIEWWNSHQQ